METLESFYKELHRAYCYYMEEENYTPLQSFYSMIEEFARFITKSKQHKTLFYTAMMQLMKAENIDEKACGNIISSYEKAIKQVKK